MGDGVEPREDDYAGEAPDNKCAQPQTASEIGVVGAGGVGGQEHPGEKNRGSDRQTSPTKDVGLSHEPMRSP